MNHNEVKPYKASDEAKKKQVAKMFDNIAHKYDFLNHFLSLNIDKIWRRKAIKFIAKSNPKKILDVATGTGDLAIQLTRRLNPKEVIGIDISQGMLNAGMKKVRKKKLENIIDLHLGDSENIEYQENTFDAITVAFGVRNFEDLQRGLSEMYRVLKPGGELVVLEFSQPQKFPVKQVYNFYFKNILPFFGKIFSKDNSAYTYLPESVGSFIYGKDFTNKLQELNFKNTKLKSLFFGVASIYYGKK